MTKRASVALLVLIPALLLGASRLEAAVTLVWSTGSTSGCLAGPVVEVLPGQRLHYFYKTNIIGSDEYVGFYDAATGTPVVSWLVGPVGPETCNPLRMWRVGDVNGSGHDDLVVEVNADEVLIIDLMAGPGAPIADWTTPGHTTKYVVASVGLDPTSSNTKLTLLETAPDPGGPVSVKQRLLNYDLGVMPAAVAPAGEPDGLMLAQNRPNPVHGATRIPYALAAPGSVELRILDVAGRVVRTMRRQGIAGPGEFEWDGRDDGGRQVRSGTFFYEVETSGRSQGRKMVVLW